MNLKRAGWLRLLIPVSQAVPAIWLCGGFLFRGEYLLSIETLDMSYGWANRLEAISWNIREALWDPTAFCGVPFLANPAARVFYPPELALRLMTPLPPETVFSLLIFLHFWLIGWGGVFWLRSHVRKLATALLGGWIWMLNGYVVSRTGYADPGFLYSLCWLPWMLGLIDRGSNPAAIPLFSLLLSIQWLSGRPDIAFYSLHLLIAYCVWKWYPRCRNNLARRRSLCELRDYGLAFIMALLLCSVQILPTLEFQRQSFHRSGEANYDFATTGSLSPGEILVTLLPFGFGDPSAPDPDTPSGPLLNYWGSGSGFHEIYFYMGQGTLLLAAMGILWGATRFKWFWSLALIFALFASMGRHSILYSFLFYGFPGWDRFRAPARILMFAIPAVSYLSSVGLDRFGSFPKAMKFRRILPLLFFALIWSFLLAASPIVKSVVMEKLASATRVGEFKGLTEVERRILDQRSHAVGNALATSALWALGPGLTLLVAARKPTLRKPALYVVPLLVLIDLVWCHGPFIPKIDKAELQKAFPEDPIIQAYRSELPDGRLLVLADVLQPQRRRLHPWFFPGRLFAYDIDTANGYMPILFRRYVETFNSIKPEEEAMVGLNLLLYSLRGIEPNLLSLFNISGIVTSRKPPPGFEVVASHAYKDLHGPSSRLFLIRNRHQFPRAFLTPLHGDRRSPEPDPSIGESKILQDSPLSIRIATNPSQPSRLVVLDAWSPGWECQVNESAVSVDTAGGCFRSVETPVGSSTVVFNYEPLGWRIGLPLSILGFLAWVTILWIQFTLRRRL